MLTSAQLPVLCKEQTEKRKRTVLVIISPLSLFSSCSVLFKWLLACPVFKRHGKYKHDKLIIHDYICTHTVDSVRTTLWLWGLRRIQNFNVYLNERELLYHPAPQTHTHTHTHTLPIFGLTWLYMCPVQSSSATSYHLPFLCSIGMATLAQAHSYSLPILVIGLAHEAPARAFQQLICLVTSVCFLSVPLSLLHTHTVHMQMAPVSTSQLRIKRKQDSI